MKITQKQAVDEANQVRYIKLGGGGRLLDYAKRQQVISLGYGLDRPAFFEAFTAGDFDSLANLFEADSNRAIPISNEIGPIKKNRSVSNIIGQLKKARVIDSGMTIWITFEAGSMWWSVSDASAQWTRKSTDDGDALVLPLLFPWTNKDVEGKTDLHINKLSGALTQVAQYRGTVCSVDQLDYVQRRLTGQYHKYAEAAVEQKTSLEESLVPLVQLLNPYDFELLVTLIFNGSGWRQVSVSGRTMKGIDLELELPITQDRAVVQIKSRADEGTVEQCLAEMGSWEGVKKIFFAYHTWSGASESERHIPFDDRHVFMDAIQISKAVVSAGLTDWLIEKIR